MPERGYYRSALSARIDTLTELNIATTAAYQACKAAGTHRPGPKFTSPRPRPRGEAQTLYIEEPICRTCGVPIPLKAGYSIRAKGTIPA